MPLSPSTATLIKSTASAQSVWQQETFAARAACLNRVADGLLARQEEYARLITREMGKRLSEARAEIEKCASVCRYYAEHGERMLTDESIETDYHASYVTYQPLGIILGIMPWNFPFWQVFRFAAPTLMAGNGCLLKHASLVQGCAIAIERLFVDAGLPACLFTHMNIDHDEIGEVIASSAVQAVTLTGSTKAGREVASIAGHHLKKTVLELGGSDAYVVLEDADLEKAAEICTTGRMINAGQSCIAAKRFIVTASRLAAFEHALLERFNRLVMGDPVDEHTDIGPMARDDLRDELHRQVQDSIAMGALLLCGGVIPSQEGAYYPPTLLTNVVPGMPAFDEELFGPVGSIVPAQDEIDAIELANNSVFGLGGGIIGNDLSRAESLARDELQAGNVFINHHVVSDPRLPFGGIKESGFGRELSSFGIREFVNAKTIVITESN